MGKNTRTFLEKGKLKLRALPRAGKFFSFNLLFCLEENVPATRISDLINMQIWEPIHFIIKTKLQHTCPYLDMLR